MQVMYSIQVVSEEWLLLLFQPFSGCEISW